MHSTPPQYSKLLPCLSIQATWQLLTRELERAGIACCRQESALVLQHVTRQSPAGFYAELQRPVTTEEAEEVDAIITRRLRREPLQYILHSAHFYGREFYVDSAVLIPRPETELLIDLLLRHARQDGIVSPRVGDVGAGSGAIAVTLACELRQAHVLVVDISDAALRVARRNAVRHEVCDRLHFVCGDLLTAVRVSLDGIVANLPYIPSADISDLSPEVARYEPRTALDGGADGLDAVRRICVQSARGLRQGGRLLLEVGQGQASAVLQMLSAAGCWDSLTSVPDLGGIPRVVTARLASAHCCERG